MNVQSTHVTSMPESKERGVIEWLEQKVQKVAGRSGFNPVGPVLQIRRGNRDSLGIISHIFPQKTYFVTYH